MLEFWRDMDYREIGHGVSIDCSPAPHLHADMQAYTHLTKLITYKELTNENSLLGNWIIGKESTIQGICVEYCALHADSYFSKNNKKKPVSPSSLLVFL